MISLSLQNNFVVKCHACGKAYLVPRRKNLGQERFLRQGPRCINTAGVIDPNHGRGAYFGVVRAGQVCGAPLGRGLWARNHFDSVTHPEELLGWTVARVEHVFTEPPAPVVVEVERVVERIITDDEVAALQAELGRLRTKYETPCLGLVPSFNADGTAAVVKCGGYLGHGGDCAPVW